MPVRTENSKGVEERLIKIEKRLDSIDKFLLSASEGYGNFGSAEQLYFASDLRNEVMEYVQYEFYVTSETELRRNR